MSTIKSSAENLTLNADGANNDIKFQSNGSEVASIDQAGVLIASGGVTVGSTSVADPVLLIQSSGSGDPQLNLSSAAANRSGKIRFLDNGSTAAGFINYTHNGNRMEFGSGSSTTIGFRVCDGYSNAAQGLTFGSDTAVANQLDDYEKGTHECAITMGTGTATLHSSKRYLKYVKIGDQVTVSGQIQISAVSSADGTFQISLPFTCSGDESDFSVGNYRSYSVDTPNDGVQAVIYSDRGTARASLEWSRDGASPTNERATNNGYYMIGLTYFTA